MTDDMSDGCPICEARIRPVRARCTTTAQTEDACLQCMWDGFDAGFAEGDALCR